MAVKATIEKVRVILDTNVGDTDITEFITTANNYLIGLEWRSTLSESVLTDIEVWLTAHFISTSRDRTTLKEKVGEAQVDYVNQFGQGLKASQYGQMAIVLDTSGTLLELSKNKIQASVKAVKSFE